MNFININYHNTFSRYDLDFLASLNGELLSEDSISNVVKLTIDDTRVILKRFYKPGKGKLRALASLSKITSHFFSRSTREFSNLLYFANNGFNTPEIILFNESKGKSFLITKELLGSQDLAKYYLENSINKVNFVYLEEFIRTIRRLHDKGFIHRDYKLRNVILGQDQKLYLIDCTQGYLDYLSILSGPFYYRMKRFLIIKDLKIVYKDLKKVLSPKQTLKLYKIYLGLSYKNKLSAQQRTNLKIIEKPYK